MLVFSKSKREKQKFQGANVIFIFSDVTLQMAETLHESVQYFSPDWNLSTNIRWLQNFVQTFTVPSCGQNFTMFVFSLRLGKFSASSCCRGCQLLFCGCLELRYVGAHVRSVIDIPFKKHERHTPFNTMSSWTDWAASQVFGDNMNVPVAPPQGLHWRYWVKCLNNDQMAVKVVTVSSNLFKALFCNW